MYSEPKKPIGILIVIALLMILVIMFSMTKLSHSLEEKNREAAAEPYLVYYSEVKLEYSYLNGTTDTADIYVSTDGYINGGIELKEGDLSYWKSCLHENKNNQGSARITIASFVKTYRVLSSVRKAVEIKY